MTLARLWVLHFLWFLPLVFLALIVAHRKKKTALERFADASLIERLTQKDHRGKAVVKGFLLLLVLGLLIFSLAGPRWGSFYQEIHQKGVDIVILVDVSASMRVQDIKPNRLEQAKREIIDFLRVVEGDRIGLVAFAGAAFVQCPLTLDYAALELFLAALEPGLIPVPGTDLGAAVETGVSAFDFKSETDKVLLLITDGEDHEQRGLEAARRAAEKGVQIFVFGIGNPSGGPIPSDDGGGGFKKDPRGNLILSKLNEEALFAIADETGGRYVQATAGDLDLDQIYFNGIKSTTRPQTLKSGKIRIQEERFSVFVLAALLLLLLESFIDKKKTSIPGALRGMLSVTFILGAMTIVSAAHATENPDRLYREGRFAEAETAYAQSDMNHPKDIRFRYNRGCAAYQNQNYSAAVAAFTSVLSRTENDRIRFMAAYNLGNTFYRAGDFKSAVSAYRQALVTNPSDDDARYNLEMALKALEKQKTDQTENSDRRTSQPSGPQHPETDENKETATPPAENTQARESGKDSDASDDPAENRPPGPEGENLPSDNRSSERYDATGASNPIQDGSEQGEKESSPGQGSMSVDRRSAEALLDNIQENPSKLFRYLFPKEKQNSGTSGKDW